MNFKIHYMDHVEIHKTLCITTCIESIFTGSDNYEKNSFKKIVIEQIDDIFDDIISDIPKTKLKHKEDVKELIDYINRTKNRMMHYNIITEKLCERNMY
ncbi:MAG TPA: hypothetical protein PK466_06785 [Thermotogota bacterium]|nr:hypothetical protein [Thermotogota bacterium]